jgi:hypothetical protein
MTTEEYARAQALMCDDSLVCKGCLIASLAQKKHHRTCILTRIKFPAEDRGAEQYRGIDMDKPMPVEDCMVMYRIITGAYRAGTQAFVDGIRELKDAYTVREIIGMVDGAYGGEIFRRFFEEENE